ncbi:hypothetical protein AX16_005984 [Volvariella volvacea WC 439]|nr:hypothetical protein AX16_005984 [Volvariella volvacea WC 439]
MFVATIVYRIFVVMPEVRKLIREIITRDPSILDANIEHQWKILIIEPLCMILHPKTITRRSLIVIDGLDECEPYPSQQSLLHLLVKFHEHGLNHRFAFLVCSRPEARIQLGMDKLASESPTHFRASLMLSETEESIQDMRLIITSRFDSIRRDRHSVIGSRQWPPDGSIERIITLAHGQFIYALTILRWLDDEEGDPVDRLDSIFGTSSDEKAEAFAPLDLLYNLVLASACSKKAGGLVLPCLLLIAGNKDYQVRDLRRLGELLETKPSNLRIALQPLHSILRVPISDDQDIEIYHTSVVEYLCDPSRSRDYCVFSSRVTTFVLPKAIKWASADTPEPNVVRLTSWVHVGALMPYETNSLTPDVLNALAGMNIKRWLRLNLLFVRFDVDTTVKNYHAFHQWLERYLPRGDQLLSAFPHDFFPPFESLSHDPFKYNFRRHLLFNWENDLQSGVLSDNETALFLYMVFLRVVASDRALNQLDLNHIRFGSTNILPNRLHTCKARKLVLSAGEFSFTKGGRRVPPDDLLNNLNIQKNTKFEGLTPIAITIKNSISTPVDILYCIEEDARPNFLESIWSWLQKRKGTEPDLRTLIGIKEIATYAYKYPHRYRYWYLQDSPPASLLDLAHVPHPASNSEELTFKQVASLLEEKIAKYPIECKCDEVLGLTRQTPNFNPGTEQKMVENSQATSTDHQHHEAPGPSPSPGPIPSSTDSEKLENAQGLSWYSRVWPILLMLSIAIAIVLSTGLVLNPFKDLYLHFT